MSNSDNHSDFLIDKQTLLNYDFKQTIGKGTFGKVKLAVDNNIKEKVAVKILNKKQIESKNEMHLVQRELDILPKFNHVNVIKVNHILQDEENYFLAWLFRFRAMCASLSAQRGIGRQRGGLDARSAYAPQCLISFHPSTLRANTSRFIGGK